MLPWHCIVVVSATTQRRTLCTWTWGVSGAGSCVPDLWVGITLSQCYRQFGIVSVNVIGEMNVTVFVGECRPVHDEDRDALDQIHGDIVFTALHALLHLF